MQLFSLLTFSRQYMMAFLVVLLGICSASDTAAALLNSTCTGTQRG
jgi:hypothetical protein